MGKIPVVLKIKMTIEKAKDKIQVREKAHRETSYRSPISNFLITDGLRNDPAGKRMGNAVHIFIVTH
jgi:hypothetical protein